MYTASQKKTTQYTLAHNFPQTLTDFQNSFDGIADRLSGKFATNTYLNISSHLTYVASLPCRVFGSTNCYV